MVNQVIQKNIAVIIPTYNAGKSIVTLIKSIKKSMPSCTIIIVDDNSPDGTAKNVKKHFDSSDVFVIQRKGKGGRGSAVLDGFRYALKKKDTEYFIEMDADLCHDPKYIKDMIAVSQNADMVIVSKYLPGSTINGLRFYRLVMSRIMNFTARKILRVPLSDYSNGYRLYRRNVVEYITGLQYQSKGFIVLSETLYKVYRAGYTISEIPFDFVQYYSQKSNMNFSEIIETIYFLLRIRFRKEHDYEKK